MSFESDQKRYNNLIKEREKAEKLAAISKLEEKELDKLETANKIIEVIKDKRKAMAKKRLKAAFRKMKGWVGI